MDSHPGEHAAEVDSQELYGISLELLHDLLTQWTELWASVAAAIDELSPDERAALYDLSADPSVGLSDAVPQFARSFHPEVVGFLVSNLEAASATVAQLSEEDRRGSIRYRGASSPDLEDRVRHLESVLGGVGAVLRTLGLPPDQSGDD